MFLRLTILVAVTLQNTSYALVRRYSRGHLKGAEHRRHRAYRGWRSRGAAAVNAAGRRAAATSRTRSDGSAMSGDVFLIGHSWKMMVPAVIYLVMNTLGFVALGHLDASTFSIAAQMKVFYDRNLLGLDPPEASADAQVARSGRPGRQGVVLISNEAMPKQHADAHGEQAR